MSRRAATAYVLGGYIPRGGTFMAYSIGRILHEHFGYECRIVRVGDEQQGDTFDYPIRFDTVDIARMEHETTATDILVVNPSFSPYSFGLRLPCKKLMYIQDYCTFQYLDGFCDHYACVSTFVQQFVRMAYGMAPPVIPAFFEPGSIPPLAPWHERPARKLFVHGKAFLPELVGEFRRQMGLRHPTIQYEIATSSPMRHRDFLARLGQFRYYVPLTPCEGFGLTSLEAMACGCTVIGFHGNGGQEFMRAGQNCEVTGYPRMDLLVDMVAGVLERPGAGEELAGRAKIDAQGYSYQRFEERWVNYLRERVR